MSTPPTRNVAPNVLLTYVCVGSLVAFLTALMFWSVQSMFPLHAALWQWWVLAIGIRLAIPVATAVTK